MEQEKLTFIKKDALIPIEIGTAFISRLQQALIFLTDDKTEQEIEAFTQAIKEGKQMEGWMLHCETLALFLKEVEDIASKKGLVEEQDVPST